MYLQFHKLRPGKSKLSPYNGEEITVKQYESRKHNHVHVTFKFESLFYSLKHVCLYQFRIIPYRWLYTVEAHLMATSLIQLVTSLLRPLFCAPKELKVWKYSHFLSFTTLLIRPPCYLKPHFCGLKVVILTEFHCTVHWALNGPSYLIPW